MNCMYVIITFIKKIKVRNTENKLRDKNFLLLKALNSEKNLSKNTFPTQDYMAENCISK